LGLNKRSANAPALVPWVSLWRSSGTRVAAILAVFLLASGPASAAEPGGIGVITGSVIRDAGRVTAVAAVERKSGLKSPGRIDAKTGRFTIDGLAVGVSYDLVLDFGPVRLEGVDFHVPRSDYEEEQPLSADDVKIIAEKVRGMNQFENLVEIMAIEGNIQHAVILLNKLRTEAFYASKPGEVVWRAELWRFERPEETWVKVQDELFTILYRERLPLAEFKKKSVSFDPALGHIELTAKAPRRDIGPVQPPPGGPGIRLRNAKEKLPKG